MSFNARKLLKTLVSSQPTYILTSNVSSVNEGGSVTFTLTTTNVSNGTSVPYTITGVSSSDINNSSLTGNFVINNNSGSVIVNITEDTLTEGTEYLVLTAGGQSVTVTINDTSLNQISDDQIYDNTTLTGTASTIFALSDDGVIMTLDPISTYGSITDNNSNYIERWKFGDRITLINNPADSTLNNLQYDVDGGSGSFLWYQTYNGGYRYSDITHSNGKWYIVFKIIPQNQMCPEYTIYTYVSDVIDSNEALNYFPKTNWKLYTAKTSSNTEDYGTTCTVNLYDDATSELGFDHDPPVQVNLNFSFSSPSSMLRDYSVAVKRIKPEDNAANKTYIQSIIDNTSTKFNYIRKIGNTLYVSKGGIVLYTSPNTFNTWRLLGIIPNSTISTEVCFIGMLNSGRIICFVKGAGIYKYELGEFINTGLVIKDNSSTGTILTNNHKWHYISMYNSNNGFGLTSDNTATARLWYIQINNYDFTSTGNWDIKLQSSSNQPVGKLTRDGDYVIDSGGNVKYLWQGGENWNYWDGSGQSVESSSMQEGTYNRVVAINHQNNTNYYLDYDAPLSSNMSYNKINPTLKSGYGRNSIIYDEKQKTFIILPKNHKKLIYIKDDNISYIGMGSNNYDEFFRVKTVSQIPVSKNWVDYTTTI